MNYKAITIYSLIIFLSVAIFGFLSMSMMDHDTHATCPFSVSESTPCPDEGKFTTAMHHINSLEEFLGVALNNNIVNILLIYVAGVFIYHSGASAVYLRYVSYFPIKRYKELHDTVYISFINLLETIKRAEKINSTWAHNKAHYYMLY